MGGDAILGDIPERFRGSNALESGVSDQGKNWRGFETWPEERFREFYGRTVEPRPLRPRSKAAWLRRRREVRRLTLEALAISPLPERLPLDVRTGGILERAGYTVERIYWQTWSQV